MSQPPPPEKMHFIRMDEGTDEAFEKLKRVHERTLQHCPSACDRGCSTASARTPLATSRDAIVAWIDRGKISSEG